MDAIATALYLFKKLKLPPPLFTDIVFLPAVCVAEYQVSRKHKQVKAWLFNLCTSAHLELSLWLHDVVKL
jgi:hypothetical protein